MCKSIWIKSASICYTIQAKVYWASFSLCWRCMWAIINLGNISNSNLCHASPAPTVS